MPHRKSDTLMQALLAERDAHIADLHAQLEEAQRLLKLEQDAHKESRRLFRRALQDLEAILAEAKDGHGVATSGVATSGVATHGVATSQADGEVASQEATKQVKVKRNRK